MGSRPSSTGPSSTSQQGSGKCPTVGWQVGRGPPRHPALSQAGHSGLDTSQGVGAGAHVPALRGHRSRGSTQQALRSAGIRGRSTPRGAARFRGRLRVRSLGPGLWPPPHTSSRRLEGRGGATARVLCGPRAQSSLPPFCSVKTPGPCAAACAWSTAPDLIASIFCPGPC